MILLSPEQMAGRAIVNPVGVFATGDAQYPPVGADHGIAPITTDIVESRRHFLHEEHRSQQDQAGAGHGKAVFSDDRTHRQLARLLAGICDLINKCFFLLLLS